MGYSCSTLLRDTLLRHSSGTLLRDTLVGLSSSSPFQLLRYSAYYSCTTRSPVLSFQLHRSGTGQIALSPAFCALDTHDLRRGVALSPAFRALDTHDLRRGLRAHGTNRTLACISHTQHARSPQRVASQVSKTSVSYETSSESQAETPIGAHTSRSPAKQFRDSSPSKQHPHTRHSQCDSDIHLYHNSQPHASRFPAPATNLSPSTRLTRTKYCACHEMSPPSHLATSRFPAPATRIALPRFKARTKSCACHEK